MVRWVVRALGTLALVTASRSGYAEPAGQTPIRVRYAAPDGCPSADRFVAEVLARTARARPARDDESAVLFDVQIAPRVNRAEGTLHVHDPEAGHSERTLSAETCSQTASALALVAALTIDPEATQTDLPAAALEPLPPEAEPSEATASAGPGVTPPPAAKDADPPQGPAPAQVTGPASPRVPPPPDRPKWLAGGGAGLNVFSNLAWTALLQPWLYAAVEQERGPELRVAVARATSDNDAARLVWTTGKLDLCPLYLGGARLGVRPCAGLELGQLHGQGRTGDVDLVQRQFWIASYVSARFVARPIGSLQVSAEGGGVIPLKRDRFVISGPGGQPNETALIHQIPTFGLYAGLSLGIRFGL